MRLVGAVRPLMDGEISRVSTEEPFFSSFGILGDAVLAAMVNVVYVMVKRTRYGG